VDTGAIVAQSRVKLDRFDTVRSMQRKVYETEPKLLLEALALIDRGAEPVPQTAGSVFPDGVLRILRLTPAFRWWTFTTRFDRAIRTITPPSFSSTERRYVCGFGAPTSRLAKKTGSRSPAFPQSW
jgi:methionyl-tRNA formyltransferase